MKKVYSLDESSKRLKATMAIVRRATDAAIARIEEAQRILDETRPGVRVHDAAVFILKDTKFTIGHGSMSGSEPPIHVIAERLPRGVRKDDGALHFAPLGTYVPVVGITPLALVEAAKHMDEVVTAMLIAAQHTYADLLAGPPVVEKE